MDVSIVYIYNIYVSSISQKLFLTSFYKVAAPERGEYHRSGDNGKI